MAPMHILSTYTRDSDTVERIASFSEKWGVSKSEVLRRPIQSAIQNQLDDRLALLAALRGVTGGLALHAMVPIT
jgi:hypothetical protein